MPTVGPTFTPSDSRGVKVAPTVVSHRRVALIADFIEESWPSMDLVANMLFDRLTSEHGSTFAVELIRPPMRRRASRLPGTRGSRAAFTVDRFTNRLWDYPREMRSLAARFDLFHIVDHSYSQLVHRLPASCTLVTCHDLDTFRSCSSRHRKRSRSFAP